MKKDEEVEGERADISLKLIEDMVKKFKICVKQEVERCWTAMHCNFKMLLSFAIYTKHYIA